MAKSLLEKYLSRIGRRGGKARLEKMTSEQRQEVARKAGLASAAARRKKAAERKHT